MAISSGKLNRRLTVMRPKKAADGYGNKSTSYIEAFVVAASVAEAKGGDMIRAGRVTGQGSVEVKVRQTSQTLAITTADRFKDKRSGKTYHIKHIADFDGRDLLMTCVQYQ